MDNPKRVHCEAHGERRATFVCQHLVQGRGLGFCEADRKPVSAEESDEVCAWCSECERVRVQQGGWDDISEGFANVTMICDACFEAARRRNQRPQSMTSDQWAGAVFALLVVVPAALLPKCGVPERLLAFRDSPWVLIPILGGAAAGWICRRRLSLAIFGALAGYSGFWCAATWGARSAATSTYEALAATGVGVLPVFLIYALYQRITKSRDALRADH
jgi:hypothetical protein